MDKIHTPPQAVPPSQEGINYYHPFKIPYRESDAKRSFLKKGLKRGKILSKSPFEKGGVASATGDFFKLCHFTTVSQEGISYCHPFKIPSREGCLRSRRGVYNFQYASKICQTIVYILILSILYLMGVSNFCLCSELREISNEDFKVVYPVGSEQPANGILNTAQDAKKNVEERLGSKISERITIYYIPAQREFLKVAKNRNENILAYAMPEKHQIIINGEKLRQTGIEGLFQTLIHEYAHIYLGISIKETIPLWLNEGLVMHLAGEGNIKRNINVSIAQALGKLIPLRDLEISFPSNPEKLSLAYDQSYMLVDFLIREKYQSKDSLAFLIETLSSPKKGSQLIDSLYDPIIRDGIESAWKNYLGKRVWNWIFILTSSSVFWLAVTMLFILAYYKKRRIKYRKIKEWEEEEVVYSSLTKKEEKEFWTPDKSDDEKWRGDEHPEENWNEYKH